MHPLFITGCARSGTTLVRNALDRHPDLNISHETYFLFNAPIYGPKPESLAGLLDDYLEHSGLGAHFKPLREKILAKLAPGDGWPQLLKAMLQADADQEGKTAWGEKTPPHLTFVPLLAKVLPEAKFLIVQRDGRDVVSSLEKTPWAPGSTEELALRWVVSIRIGQAFADRWPQRVLSVRYEDVLTDPEATLGRIMEFLGASLSPEQLKAGGRDFENSDKPWHRLVRDEFDPSRAFAWKKNMSGEKIAWLNALMRPELMLAGYEAGAEAPLPLRMRAWLHRLRRPDRFFPMSRWRFRAIGQTLFKALKRRR